MAVKLLFVIFTCRLMNCGGRLQINCHMPDSLSVALISELC